ncbi:MAG: hypothetical protein M1337_08175 [Actinobacteria bacterium]|nr:hypothetical protein [Actinomycetota bacterium]MCL5026459.1 hypothetical protein [Chloroflexota bacterium]
MVLSKNVRKLLRDETRFVVNKMKGATAPQVKLFYLAALRRTASRLIGIEFDPELVFVDYVLFGVNDTIQKRLNTLSQEQEPVIGLPERFFEKIEDALEDMASRMEQDEPTYPSLQTLVNLMFSVTPEGRYLRLKGIVVA